MEGPVGARNREKYPTPLKHFVVGQIKGGWGAIEWSETKLSESINCRYQKLKG